MNKFLFFKLWIELKKEFQCDNISDPKEAYQDYLSKKLAIRFSENKFIPNIEIKFPKSQLDAWTIDNRKEVHLNNYILFTSPFELQIPFKLSLGTPKDIEDAKHIYSLFKPNLDMKLLLQFNRKLKIADLFNKYLDNETSKN